MVKVRSAKDGDFMMEQEGEKDGRGDGAGRISVADLGLGVRFVVEYPESAESVL
jgi:hypothetical protein